jgi:hypothetical protein
MEKYAFAGTLLNPALLQRSYTHTCTLVGFLCRHKGRKDKNSVVFLLSHLDGANLIVMKILISKTRYSNFILFLFKLTNHHHPSHHQILSPHL